MENLQKNKNSLVEKAVSDRRVGEYINNINAVNNSDNVIISPKNIYPANKKYSIDKNSFRKSFVLSELLFKRKF